MLDLADTGRIVESRNGMAGIAGKVSDAAVKVININ
jgi:uncharacterized protein YkvS